MSNKIYLHNVCYVVGPQGSIKLFNMDTLLYVADFKGKLIYVFSLDVYNLNVQSCRICLMKGQTAGMDAVAAM